MDATEGGTTEVIAYASDFSGRSHQQSSGICMTRGTKRKFKSTDMEYTLMILDLFRFSVILLHTYMFAIIKPLLLMVELIDNSKGYRWSMLASP